MRKQNQKGFSLIELLIVVAIILIIAAIAIPNLLRSRMAANEASAVGSMPWGTHFCHFYETKQDLVDYYREMKDLPGEGLRDDGVHRHHELHHPLDRVTGRLPRRLRLAVDWIVTIVGAVAIVLAITPLWRRRTGPARPATWRSGSCSCRAVRRGHHWRRASRHARW